MARSARSAKRAKGYSSRRTRFRGKPRSRKRGNGPVEPSDPMIPVYALIAVGTIFVLAIPIVIFLPFIVWTIISSDWTELWITIVVLFALIIGLIFCYCIVIIIIVGFFVILKKYRILGILRKKFKRVDTLKEITGPAKDFRLRRDDSDEDFVIEIDEKEEKKVEVDEDFEDEWARIEGIETKKKDKSVVSKGDILQPQKNVRKQNVESTTVTNSNSKGDVLQPQRNLKKQSVESDGKNEVPESNYMY